MGDVELRINAGLRLHFHLDVGYLGTYIPYGLRNKDEVTLHLIKDLKWCVKPFDGGSDGDCLHKLWPNLEKLEQLEQSLKNE